MLLFRFIKRAIGWGLFHVLLVGCSLDLIDTHSIHWIPDSDFYSVTSEALNIRTDSTLEAPVLATIKKYSKVHSDYVGGEWVQILPYFDKMNIIRVNEDGNSYEKIYVSKNHLKRDKIDVHAWYFNIILVLQIIGLVIMMIVLRSTPISTFLTYSFHLTTPLIPFTLAFYKLFPAEAKFDH